MESLWNTGIFLPDYTMSYPRSQKRFFNTLQLQTFWPRFISAFVADFRFVKLSACLGNFCSLENIYCYVISPFVSQRIANLHFNIISTLLFLHISPWHKSVILRNRDDGTGMLIMLWAGWYIIRFLGGGARKVFDFSSHQMWRGSLWPQPTFPVMLLWFYVTLAET
jgi:hypothetical protein